MIIRIYIKNKNTGTFGMKVGVKTTLNMLTRLHERELVGNNLKTPENSFSTLGNCYTH